MSTLLRAPTQPRAARSALLPSSLAACPSWPTRRLLAARDIAGALSNVRRAAEVVEAVPMPPLRMAACGALALTSRTPRSAMIRGNQKESESTMSNHKQSESTGINRNEPESVGSNHKQS